MLTKENLEPFLNRNVSIGVSHLFMQDRLFFYYGCLTQVTETEILLQTKIGFKRIPLDQILDVHSDGQEE